MLRARSIIRRMKREPMGKNHQHDEDGGEVILVSKSQLKREAHALFDLGKELVGLPPAQFNRLELPEDLRQAIEEGRRITANIARKRQLQHIGKLLRNLDAEPLIRQLARVRGQANEAKAEFHRLERWRDRLIDEGDTALTEFIDRFPHADRQQLRQLARNARQERKANKPPRHGRALFRAIRDLAEAGDGPND